MPLSNLDVKHLKTIIDIKKYMCYNILEDKERGLKQ